MSDKGVDITKLQPQTRLLVETLNCLYDVEIIDPKTSTVMITGGATFTEPCLAIIEGSCGMGQDEKKRINYKTSMIIRFKKGKQRKYRSIETDAVIGVKITAPDGSWSYRLWENHNEDP